MSHNVGRVVTITPVRIGPDGPLASTSPGVWEFAFTPQPAQGGGDPRFVMLRLTNLALPGTSQVEVELGYATDVITAAVGTEAWSRPVDPKLGPIVVRFRGAAGGATLSEYGSGEPTATTYPSDPDPAKDWTFLNSVTNADVFLHGNPYAEPTYQTWLRCGGVFDWQNATCEDADPVKKATSDAVGMIINYHRHGTEVMVSTCSVTLIDSDLVLTAFHCVQEPDQLEVRSGSVTFDYETACNPPGARPAGYAPSFHKVRQMVASGRGQGDWAILQIDPPPVGITPRQLRSSGVVAGESVFTVSHPNGAVKKIQSGVIPNGDVTDVIGFDYAGGSSGSALFDANGRIIGAALSAPVPGERGPNTCRVVYQPAPPVVAALANPPAAAVPFDVMLVMDRSGSMSGPGTSGSGRTKMTEAREAASLFVQLVQTGAGHRMGMVSFSSAATVPPDTAPGAFDTAKHNQLVGSAAPYSGGSIGALSPGGMTSIGDGLQKAMSALTGLPTSTNQRAVLLMTDGLQNTAPMIAAVEPTLGNTEVHAVGFGTEAQLDGALLSRLAANHGEIYTRANDGLELEKFFGLCFGNIFEAGSLVDPIVLLGDGQRESADLPFDVCEEDRLTVIVGWNNADVTVEAIVRTPGGAVVAGGPGVVVDAARTWWFTKIELPYQGQRQGSWTVRLRRVVFTDIEFGEGPMPAVRAFVSIVPSGGPAMRPIPPVGRLYTGDRFTPRVSLRYPNGTAPHAEVEATIEGPGVALGKLVADHGLIPPDVSSDPVDAFRTTLQAIAADSGGDLPIGRSTANVTLFDDGFHDDGAFEHDGIYGIPIDDLFRFEGTYTFRAVGRYGDGCRGQRETSWAVHVEPGIDPEQTDISVAGGGPAPGGGSTGTITITPRDRFGNPLGPGRGHQFEGTGVPGTVVTGPGSDNGDGSYAFPVTWTGDDPGLVVSQPERPPVVVSPPPSAVAVPWWCRWWFPWLLLILILLIVILLLILILG